MTNPKYSIIQATMKKINSIPAKTSTQSVVVQPGSQQLGPDSCSLTSPLHP